MGIFVGMLVGVFCDPFWKRIYARLVRQREQQGGEPGGSEPEFRLPPTMLGAWIVPISLFGKRVQTATIEPGWLLILCSQALGGPRIHL